MAEEEEESILYDLLVPAEWTVEPEPLVIAAVDLITIFYGFQINYDRLPRTLLHYID